MLSTSNVGSKPKHPDMPSSLPVYKIKSDGAWGGEALYENVNFNDFMENTKCGRK